LALWQRNLDSDVNSAGYGISELEASVDTLSNWITAMQYTKEGLDNNAIPRGILSVFGQFTKETKQLFISAWDAKLRGVSNSFKLPVLFGQQGQTGDVKFTPTGEPFNEMAFAKWIALQAAIMGAIYGTDPTEIGIESFKAEKGGLNEGNDTEERLLHSRDVNFNPFMASLASHMRDELIAPFAPWVGLRFTGLIDEDARKRQEEKRRIISINESRHELGMDPHPLGWFGALPADPKFMDAEFQRLNATATYDEARSMWGGLTVYPSELVGMAPMNPSLNAMYMQATQAAGAESGGEGGDEDTNAGDNPFQALKPGQDSGQDSEANSEESLENQGNEGDNQADIFEDNQAPEKPELQADVAAKLKQV